MNKKVAENALSKYHPITKKVPKLTAAQAEAIAKMPQAGGDKKPKTKTAKSRKRK